VEGLGAEPHDLKTGTVFCGLDLSATNYLTCLVLAGSDSLDGTWSVVPILSLPEQGLAEGSRSDRVPYDLWAEQGWLELGAGASISYEFVAQRLRGLVDEYQIKRIAFDRWGFGHFLGCDDQRDVRRIWPGLQVDEPRAARS
jgi:phage terminase large subunit-like protein